VLGWFVCLSVCFCEWASEWLGEWSKDTYTVVTTATSVSQYPSKDMIYINRWTDRLSVERTAKRHHELSSEHYVWFQASAAKWRRSMVFWDITTTTIHCVISENADHMNITLTQLHDTTISSMYIQWYIITHKSKIMKGNWIHFKKTILYWPQLSWSYFSTFT